MNLDEFRTMHKKLDMSIEALKSLLENNYEGEFHDFKAQLELSDPLQVADLAKDVAAFHNAVGGYIVFGVEDKTFRPVGFNAAHTMDTKTVSDQLEKYLGNSVSVIYAHHELGGVQYGLLLVSRKDSVPVLMLKDSPLKGGKHIFRRNDVCLRVGDQTRIVSDARKIRELFSPEGTRPIDLVAVAYHSEPLQKLIRPDYKVFIGRERYKQQLMSALSFNERAWIVSINGIGGVGKTALATWASWECRETDMYDVIISVSAKQRELTRTGIKPVVPTVVSYESLLDEIAEVIGYPFPEDAELEQKEREAEELLSLGKTLLVVDNFETIEDDRIGEFLRNLKGDTKALVTTRRRLGKGEYSISLREMDDQESLRYIWHLASQQCVDRVFSSSDEDVQRLITASGKLPLAMKWLIGQVKSYGDIPSALDELDRLGKRTGDVLEFCFRGIFKVLSPDAQHVLCIMPIFQKAPTYLEAKFAADLTDERLNAALDQLKDMSLVEQIDAEDQDSAQYAVLPLTLKFAQKELSKRQGLESAARKRVADYYNLKSANAAAQRQYQMLYGAPAGSQKERTAVFLSQMATSAYHRNGDYEEAVGLFRRALEVLPTSRDALLGWALIERQEGNFGRAEELFEETTKTPAGKKDPRAWAFWGNMLKDLKRWNDAAQKLEVATSLQPENVKLCHQLGFCHSLAGHFKLADECYDRILASERPLSNEVRVYVYRAKAQNYFHWRKYPESLVAWEKVLELNPDDSQAAEEKRKVEDMLAARPNQRRRGASWRNAPWRPR